MRDDRWVDLDRPRLAYKERLDGVSRRSIKTLQQTHRQGDKNNVKNIRPTQPALKNNVTNVRPTQPALKNNVTNIRLAQPALKNNVTNIRPISNIFNLLAKQGQTSQSQLPNTTPNTQFKSTSPSQMSNSQPPKTTPNTQSKQQVITDKSTSPGQILDSQPPKTTPNTQSKKHVITDKSTSPGQISDSQPPKTTPNIQSKKHVITDKSTSPGQALKKGKLVEQEDVCKKTKTPPVCPAMSIQDYCEMMGDKVLDEDMEQVSDGDKDMEQVPDGDKDME
ncbi:hypothetical protein ACFE04_006683 [Oxalis oulophora]